MDTPKAQHSFSDNFPQHILNKMHLSSKQSIIRIRKSQEIEQKTKSMGKKLENVKEASNICPRLAYNRKADKQVDIIPTSLNTSTSSRINKTYSHTKKPVVRVKILGIRQRTMHMEEIGNTRTGSKEFEEQTVRDEKIETHEELRSSKWRPTDCMDKMLSQSNTKVRSLQTGSHCLPRAM